MSCSCIMLCFALTFRSVSEVTVVLKNQGEDTGSQGSGGRGTSMRRSAGVLANVRGVLGAKAQRSVM